MAERNLNAPIHGYPSHRRMTAEAVAGAHQMDLDHQAEHGVTYQNYWVDLSTGTVHCLVDAPNKEAALAVHRDGHGLLPHEIIEVTQGQ